MPLEMNDGIAVMSGHAEITEAEALLTWLRDTPDPVVDVTNCPSAHTAVLQVLLAMAPEVVGAEGASDWRALIKGPLVPRSEDVFDDLDAELEKIDP